MLLIGCGGSGGYVVVHADRAWPAETLRDWVSFGDQLSVIEVVAESAPARWPEYKNSGGLLGRRVTVRIERTLWRRPNSAPPPGRVIRFASWGWMMGSDQHPFSSRRRVVGEHEPRLEVGGRYLAVLAKDEREWFAIGEATMTLAADDTITSQVVAGSPAAGAAALRGKSIEQAAQTLAATRPLPLARKYGHLPPADRWKEMVLARDA